MPTLPMLEEARVAVEEHLATRVLQEVLERGPAERRNEICHSFEQSGSWNRRTADVKDQSFLQMSCRVRQSPNRWQL